MSAQTLTLAGKRYVLLTESEYRRLRQRQEAAANEDARDAALLTRRLTQMRRCGKGPVPYTQARHELNLS